MTHTEIDKAHNAAGACILAAEQLRMSILLDMAATEPETVLAKFEQLREALEQYQRDAQPHTEAIAGIGAGIVTVDDVAAPSYHEAAYLVSGLLFKTFELFHSLAVRGQVDEVSEDRFDVPSSKAVSMALAGIQSEAARLKARTPREFIDVTTAAARLGKPARTITDWCGKGKHPCHNAEQIGGKWAIPDSDIPAK